MTRATILMTLGTVAITMTTQVLALSEDSPELLNALWGDTQDPRILREKAKAGDDAALKEVILAYMRISVGAPNAPDDILQIHIENDGVSRERMVKVLDEIMRENLSVLGTESQAKHSKWYVLNVFRILPKLPGEDTLALFKEYAELTMDEHFSEGATKIYDRMLRALQEQANPTNDVPQNVESPPETKQESPPVIAPDTASVGRDNLGASSTNSPPAEGRPKGRSPEGGVVPDTNPPDPPPIVIARNEAKQSILYIAIAAVIIGLGAWFTKRKLA